VHFFRAKNASVHKFAAYRIKGKKGDPMGEESPEGLEGGKKKNDRSPEGKKTREYC
jgi:hypothetical protein